VAEFFSTQLSEKIINTVILLFLFGGAYVLFLAIIKYKDIEDKNKYRKRFLYISGFIASYFIGRLWMEGFVPLFAFLGLISAALTITQKESLMNLTGWLIIMWRQLFTEGDRIEIGTATGYVESMGIFYVTLSEYYPQKGKTSSKRIIKIPNGLVIHHPVVNHTKVSNFLEYRFSLLVTPDSNLKSVRNLLVSVFEEKIYPKYFKLSEKDKLKHFPAMIKVYFKPKFDEPSGVEAIANYYCHPKDHIELEREYTELVLLELRNQKEIKLSFAAVREVKILASDSLRNTPLHSPASLSAISSSKKETEQVS
jgi:small-conductance mechanosensitive channel